MRGKTKIRKKMEKKSRFFLNIFFSRFFKGMNKEKYHLIGVEMNFACKSLF